MLRWRLIAAAGIIIPILILVWLDDQWNGGRPGIWLGPIAFGIALLAAHESCDLLRAAGWKVVPGAQLAAVAVALLASLAPIAWVDYPDDCPLGKPGWALLGLGAGIAVVFTVEILRFEDAKPALERVVSGLFTLVYVGALFGIVCQIRLIEPGRVGLLALLTTMIVVKFADTSAFAVGKTMGRTKLAPRLSPGKTVEGAVGAVVGAIVAAMAVRGLLLPWAIPSEVLLGSYLAYAAFGFCIAVAGMIGDLAESLLKRAAERKDSSSWLPGLGGVLDVVDSLLAVAPVSFGWWISGMLVTS